MSATSATGSSLSRVQEAVSAFWMERDQRERTLITLAIAVAVLGLVYLLFVAPALSGRVQLEKSLPNLRQQALLMQDMSKEAATLAAVTAAPATRMTKESIEAALARRTLKPQSVVLIGETAKIQLTGASFARMMEWLDEIQKSERITVLDANIVAQSQLDTVNATLTLKQ